MKSSQVTVSEVSLNLDALGDTLARLFEAVVQAIPEPYNCTCLHALDGAFL